MAQPDATVSAVETAAAGATLFDKYNEKPKETELQATSARQQLINDIVENMPGVKNKKASARRFAIAANTIGFSNQVLHYLGNRNNFPCVKDYSAFVNSRFTITTKRPQEQWQ